jgi:hypothetical protein
MIAPQLGDQQLKMRHHRLGSGGAGLGVLGRCEDRDERCLLRRDVVGQGWDCVVMT